MSTPAPVPEPSSRCASWSGSPADLAWTLGVAFVVLGPLLSTRGFWLFGDMVFVPRQPWKSAWLGLDGSLPRAVPMDAVVSLVSVVVPGDLVQKAFLLGAFVLGGMGAGRVVRAHAWYARAGAVTFWLWNPWVHERLMIGQWAILAGYLALPWAVLAARRWRADVRRGWAPVAVVLVASAVCSPSSGLTAIVVLLVLVARRGVRDLAGVLLLGAVANLPWLVPSLVARSAQLDVGEAFAAFAARGESPAGLAASLLSFGGIWKSSVVAGERTDAAWVLLSCVLTAAALAGLRHARVPAGERGRLLVLAGLALLAAALPALPGGLALLRAVGEQVPALALLRDSHRYLAPALLVVLPGTAGAVTWLRAQVAPGREALWGVVGLALLAPPLLLPSLAWGDLGRLETVRYPVVWQETREVMGYLDPSGDAVSVVLPWRGSYRGFAWNDARAGLDPAPRYFRGDVLVDDRLLVDDRVLPAEDPRVRALDAVLGDDVDLGPAEQATALRGLGVRFVLVEHLPGLPAPTEPAGEIVVDTGDLTLVDLGPAAADSSGRLVTRPGNDYTGVVIAGDLGSGVLLVTAVTWILRRGSGRRHDLRAA